MKSFCKCVLLKLAWKKQERKKYPAIRMMTTGKTKRMRRIRQVVACRLETVLAASIAVQALLQEMSLSSKVLDKVPMGKVESNPCESKVSGGCYPCLGTRAVRTVPKHRSKSLHPLKHRIRPSLPLHPPRKRLQVIKQTQIQLLRWIEE